MPRALELAVETAIILVCVPGAWFLPGYLCSCPEYWWTKWRNR